MSAFLEGYECLEYKDYANAYQIFNDLYKRDNHNVEVIFNLGLCYIKLEDYTKALILYNLAYQQLQQRFENTIGRDINYKKLQRTTGQINDLLVPIREGYSQKYSKQVRVRILQILLIQLVEVLSEEQITRYQKLLDKENT